MESPEIGFGGGGGGGSSCGIASSSAAASAGGTKTTLFHFNTTSSSTTSTAHTLFFGSSPEGMSNGRGPAFTLVQREELERQTMIFKYMMASVPVPPQLLLPLTKNQRNSVSSCSSLSSGAATDSEPWRCRRTDGKKWRCSRDVAPHQKYCERHSHKNRPRSRKPVELTSSINSTTTTRLQHIINSRNNSSSVTAVSSPLPSHQDSSHHHYLTLVNTQQQTDFSHASAPPSPRCLEWFTRGEVIAVPNSDQDWHHQHTKDLYHLKQHSHVPPDLCPYPDQARADALNDQCSLLLGLPSSLEGASNNNNDTHDHDKAGPCSLLSLAVFSDHVGQDRGGQVCNEEEEDGSNGKRGGDLKPHWMSSGGPLAEALCLGSTGLDKSGPSHD